VITGPEARRRTLFSMPFPSPGACNDGPVSTAKASSFLNCLGGEVATGVGR
jgi:hypothetical protein